MKSSCLHLSSGLLTEFRSDICSMTTGEMSTLYTFLKPLSYNSSLKIEFPQPKFKIFMASLHLVDSLFSSLACSVDAGVNFLMTYSNKGSIASKSSSLKRQLNDIIDTNQKWFPLDHGSVSPSSLGLHSLAY